jgi:hypothetical protein
MTGPAIYYIECTKNGKRYIGSTSCDANNRMSNHKFRLRKGTHVNKSLQDDWNTFGEAAFNFIMLGTYPLESVVKEEERIGLEWGCFSKEKGYNMVRPVNIHTYDNLNGYRKFTGRTKGPEKVLYRKRLLPWQAEMLDKMMPKLTAAGITREEAEILMEGVGGWSGKDIFDGREPDKSVSQPVSPIVIESNEVVKLRAEVDRLRKKVKEYEQMYQG